MKYTRDLEHAKATLGSLRGMIADTESPLMRYSLEERLEEWVKEVATAERRVETLAEGSLLFDGDPVRAKVGIDASFGGQGVRAFEDLVAVVDAALAPGGVGDRGKLSAAPRLFITGVEGGSFGFQLAEIPGQDSLMSPSRLKLALDRTTKLVEAAAVSDEAFSEALAERPLRVFNKLKNFLKVVSDNKATVRINTGKSRAMLDTVERVRMALERVDSTSMEEIPESMVGTLTGILPERKNFELRTENGETISGRISQDLNLADLVRHFNKEVVATLSRVVIKHVARESTSWVLEDVTDPSPQK